MSSSWARYRTLKWHAQWGGFQSNLAAEKQWGIDGRGCNERRTGARTCLVVLSLFLAMGHIKGMWGHLVQCYRSPGEAWVRTLSRCWNMPWAQTEPLSETRTMHLKVKSLTGAHQGLACVVDVVQGSRNINTRKGRRIGKIEALESFSQDVNPGSTVCYLSNLGQVSSLLWPSMWEPGRWRCVHFPHVVLLRITQHI